MIETLGRSKNTFFKRQTNAVNIQYVYTEYPYIAYNICDEPKYILTEFSDINDGDSYPRHFTAIPHVCDVTMAI